MAAAGEDVLFAGVAELSRRLRARELSPVELAEACLGRIEALAPRVGCFVTVTPERAREDARRAEASILSGRWRGPLHGIPTGLEDVLDTQGIRTTFGARPHAERIPARDATLVSRLAEAGAVLAGKLSTIELAGGLGFRSAAAALNGACRTPWDLARWAGGASSGPAAAVAAGLVAYAVGSETWGSLEAAAAHCGVTGFSPTYGVLSRHGAMPVAYSLDRLGAVCRSAEDCALVASVLAGADPRDPSSIQPPPGLDRVRAEIPRALRVGVVGFTPGKEPLRGARERFAAARDVLRDGGALLEEASLPALPYAGIASVIVQAEAANAFEELVRSGRTRELSDPSHLKKGPGDYVPRASSADYVRAARLRGEVQRALARFFEKHDLLLAPNDPFAPPRVDEALPDPWQARDALAAAADLAGLPTVVLPMGLAGSSPVSLRLVAPPLEDARVLSAALLFQSRTSHHLQRPPPPAEGPAVAAMTSP